MNRKKFRWTPARLLASAFAFLSVVGSLLLYLPLSHAPGRTITYVDALYTAVSALCVTGLSVVDLSTTFNSFGHLVIAVLIQIGGIGVSAIGAGFLLMLGKKVGMRERSLIHDTMNLNSYAGVVKFIHTLFFTTILIECVGAILAFFVFSKHYDTLSAMGLSVFHSISSFNNAGLSIMSQDRNMSMYADDPYMLILTMGMVFLGGLGFVVIHECWTEKFHWHRLSMHSRVSLFMAGALLLGGGLFLKLTDNVSWVVALFSSQAARSAGYEVYPFECWSPAGMLLIMLLMFIGTSSGSTGGGVKTSTVFTLILGVKQVATNGRAEAFHYSLPPLAFRKSAVIVIMAVADVIFSTFVLLLVCPELSLAEGFTEICSAFTTVGLSLGTTASLNDWGKLISIIVMLTGRIGPMTIANAWYFRSEARAHYPEGNIMVG